MKNSGGDVIRILESLLQNQSVYSKLIIDVVDVWMSKDLISPSVLLENSSFLASIVQVVMSSSYHLVAFTSV